MNKCPRHGKVLRRFLITRQPLRFWASEGGVKCQHTPELSGQIVVLVKYFVFSIRFLKRHFVVAFLAVREYIAGLHLY